MHDQPDDVVIGIQSGFFSFAFHSFLELPQCENSRVHENNVVTPMSYLRKYWTKYKYLFLLSVFCVSCEAVCDLLQPRFMSRLIDYGVAKGDLAFVVHTGLIMLGIVVVGACFAMTRNIAASRASQGFGKDMRHDLFVKVQSLSVEEMDRFEGGSLVTRMTNDITQLQNFTNGMMRIFFKAPIMCVGAIIMAATLNVRSIYIIAPVVAVVGFVIGVSMRLTYPRFARVQRALDKLNTTMREYLAGIRLVKAFRRFAEEEKRFSAANEALTDSTVRANRVLAILSPLMTLTVNAGVAAIVFFGARWIGKGDMQVGDITAFVSYMTQILTSLGTISNVLNQFVRVKTSNERIREVMGIKTAGAVPEPPLLSDGTGHEGAAHIEPDGAAHVGFGGAAHIGFGGAAHIGFDGAAHVEPGGAAHIGFEGAAHIGFEGSAHIELDGAAHIEPEGAAHIKFDGVGFEYAGSTGQAALAGLSFSLERGGTLGVIGPTGSGKSTLAALLMRFYTATRGEIRISGVPIDRIPEDVLRGRTAIVPQTAALFTGTIKDNILWGKEDAGEAEIEAAAGAAEAHGFIAAMPDGYDTVIGQSGVNLSGGQKQRVSIARALIREPEILVLDDCTSALDVMTEARVKRALRRFSEHMTCVLITQRVNTAMNCDRILVLDSGNQAGFGTHAELMETCPVYRDIYMSQIGGEAV